MNGSFSERRLVENEVVFSRHNRRVLDALKKYAGKIGLHEPFSDFYCECSSPYCMERIAISPNQYIDIHRSKKRFTIKPGHETPAIERVVEQNPSYLVVEKYMTPPPANTATLHI